MALKIMISSTRADLMQYRERTSAIIDKLRKEHQGKHEIIEVSMEEAVQTGKREYPVAISKKWVEEADWIVVIVGWHYGTITAEDDAGGIGVTEWEYQHAMAMQKRVFVFVSGELGTDGAYRAGPDDNKCLVDWAADPLSTDDQRIKIRAFRGELTKRHATVFKNINDFEFNVERTLRQNFNDLPLDIRRGTALAELILSVQPAIGKCASSLQVLHRYKTIHDALHTIREHAIKPARDQALPRWVKDGDVRFGTNNLLNQLSTEADKGFVAIDLWTSDLHEGKSPDLLDYLNKAKRHLPIWDPPTEDDGPVPDRGEFEDNLQDFTAAVQWAFTEANDAMLGQAGVFDELRDSLLEELAGERDEQPLPDEQSRALDEEITKFKRNAKRLKNSLNAHSRWQKLHNEIETLQGYRDTSDYSKKLKCFFEQKREALIRLADDTVSYAKRNPHERTALVDILDKLKDELQAWSNAESEETVGIVRNLFDDAFFKVDKCTLLVVTRSSDTVTAFNEMVRKLHNVQTNDKPTSLTGEHV